MSALLDAKNSKFFEIYGMSARTRGSIFRDFVRTSFMDGPHLNTKTLQNK